MKGVNIENATFFGDPALDRDLPMVNESFWCSLVDHIERDRIPPPRVILDVGCHTGGLIEALSRRFAPAELYGIEPLAAARLAASRCPSASIRGPINSRSNPLA